MWVILATAKVRLSMGRGRRMELSVVSRRTDVKSEIKATAVMTMTTENTKTMAEKTDCIQMSITPTNKPMKT